LSNQHIASHTINLFWYFSDITALDILFSSVPNPLKRIINHCQCYNWALSILRREHFPPLTDKQEKGKRVKVAVKYYESIKKLHFFQCCQRQCAVRFLFVKN
jgi:hypothetical protein